MPLLRKETFVRKKPDKDLTENDKVFFCEATKEVFRYDFIPGLAALSQCMQAS